MFPRIQARRSGIIPCHFHHQASQREHRVPLGSTAFKQWAVGQREWKGPVKLPRTSVCLWAGSHGPGPWASGPGSCSEFLFLLLGLFVWPLLNGPLSAGLGRGSHGWPDSLTRSYPPKPAQGPGRGLLCTAAHHPDSLELD